MGVSGIGPKLALAVLSTAFTGQAIATGFGSASAKAAPMRCPAAGSRC